MFPQAYVYPREMRATRDLLRRRTHLVRLRTEAVAHVENTVSQYNPPAIDKKLRYADNRDLALAEHLDEQIRGVELHLTKSARIDDPQAYQRLQTIPDVGKVLGLILLY